MNPDRWKIVLFVVLSYVGYVLLGYFIPREDFFELILTFTLLFALLVVARIQGLALSPRSMVYVGILFRSSLLLSFPHFSDDIFRFAWDGTLVASGENPYVHLPSDVVQSPLGEELGLGEQWYNLLNSPHYYTVYPPVSQAVFGISSLLGGGNVFGIVFWMRVLLLIGEGATMMLLLRLLQAYKLPSGNIMFYAWNPLVIMEVVGNLHFEGLMLLGILGALYALHRKKQHWSGVAMGLAISTKLIPLMLVPAFFRYLGMRKWLLWSVVAGLVFVVTFLPFVLSGFPASMLDSVDLYFRSFEFNASIFYLVRAIGFAAVGYDIIHWSGPVLGVISAVSLLVLAFAKWGSSLPGRMVVMLTCYYMLATTIHPWYIVTLVGLATLSGHAYAMVWSFLVLLSYSHYFGGGFNEHYWVIALEYALLLAAMVWNGKISRWIKMSSVNSGV